MAEAMVRMPSKHLVEELLWHKPREGEYEAQRRSEDLSRFYVGANRYEQEAAIGDHTDSNPLYVVPPLPATSGHQLQLGGRWDLVDFTHNEGRHAVRARQHIHGVNS